MRSSRLFLFGVAVVAALAGATHVFAAGTAATPPLASGIVDVTTNLAYQNASAAGTGMVLTASGEVLTNNHVIRGATTIRVIDPSTGRSYGATVVGYSVANDVAVLQLQGASQLRTVHVASLGVKVGQRVTALGNAGGANGKPIAAAGKVTAVGQSITASDGQGISEQLVSLIQTNAALQPGDSGGPLLNASGRVVGMNTAASVGFQFQHVNQAYAIPISRALTLARQMVAGLASATVHIGSTPFLGVSVSQGANGLLVGSVVPGSPADLAGIVAGDTLTALDGQPVGSYDALSVLILQHSAGDTVTLQWLDQSGAAVAAPRSAREPTRAPARGARCAGSCR
jgi:S1-C subfamily serine protease